MRCVVCTGARELELREDAAKLKLQHLSIAEVQARAQVRESARPLFTQAAIHARQQQRHAERSLRRR